MKPVMSTPMRISRTAQQDDALTLVGESWSDYGVVLSCIRYAVVCSVSFVLLARVSTGFAAQPSCDQWNTWEFFRDASSETVVHCLKTMNVDARDSEGRSPLHFAAEMGNLAAVVTLVMAGADVNEQDNGGYTPLHLSVYRASTPIVQSLVAAGTDVNTREKAKGCTPLHGAAAAQNDPAVITALLKAGADVNVQCVYAGRPTGLTPLHLAAQYNDELAITETLLGAGADLDAREYNGETPLHRTAGIQTIHQENPAIITALIAAGADLDARNNSGNTPIQGARERIGKGRKLPDEILAAFTDRTAVAAHKEKRRQAQAAARQQEVEQQVREAQVSCDKWNTPTFFRHAGAEDVARCLEMNDPNAVDDQGRTPMHLAALDGTPEVMAALAEAGADPDALDDKGRTPLHLVAYFGANPETVAALVQAGADLSAPDARGRTPLEFAEKFSEAPAIVAALRDAVAAATAPPEPGPSAAAAASVSCADWNTARFFRNATVDDVVRCLDTEDPNARNQSGRTPMHYAAQGALPALVGALAEAGAELNAPDGKGGWTPLHLAAWFSTTPSVVAALLAVGADPAARDDTGKTPWDYARENAALEGTPPYWRLQEEASE